MSRFAYKGRNPQGAPVMGTMEADSPEAVALRLSQAGVVPVTITRERVHLPIKTPQKREQRVRPEELIFFTRQMTTLIRAGISLTEGLAALRRETKNPGLRTILDAIQRQVEGGMSFSEALARHPRNFPEIYIHSVRAAEEGGFLDQALERLATMLENQLETRRRIASAFRYPLFVMIALGIGVVILLGFVIPRFAQFYSGFNATLPLPTRMVLALGAAMNAYWPIFLGSILATVLAVRWALRQPWGRRTWDTWKLKLPVVGPLVLKLTVARFGQLLGTMVSTGIPLVPALDLTSRAIGNTVIGREIVRARKAVEGGESLAAPLARITLLPPLLTEMVAIGERTGALDTLLGSIADHYENEANHTIKNLPTIIEPILLVTVAGLVLVLALAVFLPLWDMVNLVKR
ncbi:MAG: type II secretion system F family protein [Candidatus Methylomirabilales bacterium]